MSVPWNVLAVLIEVRQMPEYPISFASSIILDGESA
jgi:hypothetical protein